MSRDSWRNGAHSITCGLSRSPILRPESLTGALAPLAGLGRSLLPPYLHPRKHLTFCLESLVRVVLQHPLGELPGHGLDNVLELTGREQVRDDRVAQVVEPEAG